MSILEKTIILLELILLASLLFSLLVFKLACRKLHKHNDLKVLALSKAKRILKLK